MTKPIFAATRVRTPDAPALVAGVHDVLWVSQAGPAETLSLKAAADRVRGERRL